MMFEAECTYHIYNHANGSDNLFNEAKNYPYFMKRYAEYIHPVAETFAYNLLRNHFHVMIKVRREEEVVQNLGREAFQKFETFGKLVSRQFGSFCSAYTQAFNKVYGRRGSLFQPNIKKKKVEDDAYFTQLILYIHNNPVKHGFVKNLYDWPYSSIHEYVRNTDRNRQLSKSSQLLESSAKTAVIDWFGGLDAFKKAHEDVGELWSVFD